MNVAPGPAEITRLLDTFEDLADFDIADTERQAVEFERAAEAAGETELFWRARLLRADMIERRGELAAAARLIAQVQAWAAENGSRRVLSRAHRVLARLYRAMGDVAAYLDHSIQCVDSLDDTTPVAGRIACLVKLADAFAESGSMPAARERYELAITMAAEHGIVRRQLMALNNYAYAEYDQGELSLARTVLDRLRAAGPLDFSALDTAARVEALLGDHAAAERSAPAAITTYHQEHAAEADAETDLLLTLAFVQRLRGDLAAAQVTLDRVRARCESAGLILNGVRCRLEQADVHAAAGDYQQAYLAMRDFYAAEKELRSAQRDAQARNRQALFEVTEARRQAEWFREQARRDPLTGLRNRRYVDEQLPRLLDAALAGGSSLTVALFDLDHFKRVNDTFSHETGDTVLTTVAALLGQVGTGAGGFAARLGGEEFLLVITGIDSVAATFRLEDTRQAIAAHPWPPITGSLPVTVSVGVSAAVPGSTAASVLAAADEALYQAKNAGRDRVCVAGGISSALPKLV